MPYLTPEPRGFVGRPLIALLFAVGMGILGYNVSVWMHSDLATVAILVAAVIVIVGYLWHRAEEPE